MDGSFGYWFFRFVCLSVFSYIACYHGLLNVFYSILLLCFNYYVCPTHTDIRDVNDEWVRVHAQAGDFIVFPSGIDHRFSVDENNYIQAMRLFQGSEDPDWSSVARTNQTDNASRQQYVDTYLCGIEPSSRSDSEEDSHDHSSHVHDLTPAETAPPDEADAEVNSAASARTKLGSSRMSMTMLIISSISIAATTTSL